MKMYIHIFRENWRLAVHKRLPSHFVSGMSASAVTLLQQRIKIYVYHMFYNFSDCRNKQPNRSLKSWCEKFAVCPFFFSSSLSGFPLFVTRFLFLGVIFSASLIRAYLKLITFVIIVHIKESWATIEMKRHQSIRMRRAREFHCTEMQNKRRKTHTLPYFMSCWNRYLNGLKLKCSRWWRDKRARSHYKHFIMARKCLPLKNQATAMTASTPVKTHTLERRQRKNKKEDVSGSRSYLIHQKS